MDRRLQPRPGEHLAACETLPTDLVGGNPSGVSGINDCTIVEPLADGRLLMRYFGEALATDPSNTRFARVRTPPGTRFAGIEEGLLTAATHEANGGRLVSYDGGATWDSPSASGSS